MTHHPIDSEQPRPEGLRERKRRETRLRIATAGMRLFIANGFDGTTLDAVAAEAGIARRTFFSYFKSKEDILLAWQSGAWDALRADLLKESPDQAPLDVVRRALVKNIPSYASDEMIIIDRLLRSTESLRARKQAGYEGQEQALFAALCEVWRQPERRTALRLVAMVSIGAMRVALEAWSEHGGTRPVATYLQEAFASLTAEIQPAVAGAPPARPMAPRNDMPDAEE